MVGWCNPAPRFNIGIAIDRTSRMIRAQTNWSNTILEWTSFIYGKAKFLKELYFPSP